MYTTTLARLAAATRTANYIDTGLWADAFKTDATRAVAEQAKDRAVSRVERCLYILRARYGVDLRREGAEGILAFCNS